MESPSTKDYVPSEAEGKAHAEGPAIARNDNQYDLVTSDDLLIKSEPSRSRSTTRTKSKSRSRKRKPSTSGYLTTKKIKQLRSLYSDKYRCLLNDEIFSAASGADPNNEDHDLQPSQIGLTVWSSDEKRQFFACIEKKGTTDLQSIAAAIGTKSEPEVQIYVHLLRSASVEFYLHGSRKLPDTRMRDLGLPDIPAAFEISEPCVQALDRAAEALAVKQDQYEMQRERERHKDLWLLDEKAAAVLEETGSGEGPVTSGGHDPLAAAARILDLTAFLELAERIFMNSSNLEGNWRSYSGPDESPSMYCTAFTDLHNLVVSITKRVVSAAIFLTNSRLRVSNSSRYKHSNHVRRQDVVAALNVLGMKSNWEDFWVGAARRCNLSIYEGRKRDERMELDDVETILRGCIGTDRKGAIDSTVNGRSSLRTASEKILTGVHSSGDSDMSEASIESPDIDIKRTGSASIRGRKNSYSEREDGTDLEEYVNAIDAQASMEEDQRLWSLLAEFETQESTLEDIKLPPKPRLLRPLAEDLADWRERIEYKSPWERYDVPVPADAFAIPRSLGKAPQTGTAQILKTADRVESESEKDGSSSEPNSEGLSGEEGLVSSPRIPEHLRIPESSAEPLLSKFAIDPEQELSAGRPSRGRTVRQFSESEGDMEDDEDDGN